MEDDHSDTAEDPGRRESELQLRRKVNSKYLDDVIQQTEMDYEETVEMLEREKRAMDSMDEGYLQSMDALLIRDPEGRIRRTSGNSNSDSRAANAGALLNAADQLLQVRQKAATYVVSHSRQSPTDHSSYQEAREREQQRVKDILAAGRRVMERDLDAVQQQAVEAKRYLRGNDEEVAAQAMAVFHHDRKRTDGVAAENGKALKYLQKGVKKMTKGLLSSDV